MWRGSRLRSGRWSRALRSERVELKLVRRVAKRGHVLALPAAARSSGIRDSIQSFWSLSRSARCLWYRRSDGVAELRSFGTTNFRASQRHSAREPWSRGADRSAFRHHLGPELPREPMQSWRTRPHRGQRRVDEDNVAISCDDVTDAGVLATVIEALGRGACYSNNVGRNISRQCRTPEVLKSPAGSCPDLRPGSHRCPAREPVPEIGHDLEFPTTER